MFSSGGHLVNRSDRLTRALGDVRGGSWQVLAQVRVVVKVPERGRVLPRRAGLWVHPWRRV